MTSLKGAVCGPVKAEGIVPVARTALATRITRELDRHGSVVVTGRAGVGKTYLVDNSVYAQCSPRFGSMIRWSPEIEGHLASRTREFVPNWNPPVLLLVDDVVGPEALPDILLNHGLQLIIVSHASARRWRHVPNFPALVEVGPFEREESVRFLTANLDGITEADADRLAAHLGDLPLALDRAVRRFGPDTSVDGFLQRIKPVAHLLVNDRDPSSRSPTPEGEVRSAVEELPVSGRLAPRIVAGALALMDGAPYPAALLDVQPPWQPWRTASVSLPPERRVPLHSLTATVLPDLERRGLLRIADGNAHLVWLTCQSVQRALRPLERARAAQLAETMLLSLLPDSKGDAEWGHWPTWRASHRALNTIDPSCMTTAPGRHALLAACDYLIGQGRPAEASQRLLALRETWRHTENIPLSLRLKTLDLLGRASYESGDIQKARRYGGTALRARQQTDHEWRLNPCALSGAAHWALATQRYDWLEELRRLAQALPDQRLALRIHSFAMLVHVESLYGLCLADPLKKIVRSQCDILTPEHPHSLFTMVVLARSYQRSGRADEARATLLKVLELRNKSLGPGHPHTQATAVEVHGQHREFE
ncbi:tetratricopeptide repeat protein [Streptomyces sp. NPDC005385]|uniref:tetratricopeptide repeat protein n=1 Tax=Streptomyces sp. NPDC005385 TaxID=3157039 RepID=UPI0033BF6E2D